MGSLGSAVEYICVCMCVKCVSYQLKRHEEKVRKHVNEKVDKKLIKKKKQTKQNRSKARGKGKKAYELKKWTKN